MRSFLVIAIALIGFAAHADIPAPRILSQEGSIGAVESEVLYKSIPGPAMPIDVLRTRNSSAKVLRAEDGLNQVICIHALDLLTKKESYTCKTQSSTDGKKLQVYKPAVRMG